MKLGPVHPLTGPIYVKGAEPGDLLEIKLTTSNVTPGNRGDIPARCRDLVFCAMSFRNRSWSTGILLVTMPSRRRSQACGFRARRSPALSVLPLRRRCVKPTTKREAEVAGRGGFALPPVTEDAVPPHGPIAEQGLRTIPPRETGGNMDIKQLTPGVSLFLPVYVTGRSSRRETFTSPRATARPAERPSRCARRCTSSSRCTRVRRNGATSGVPQFMRGEYFTLPEMAAPRRFYATTGMSIREDGSQESEDASLAARNALLSMIDYLGDARVHAAAGVRAVQCRG